jgi:hypothetical protein
MIEVAKPFCGAYFATFAAPSGLLPGQKLPIGKAGTQTPPERLRSSPRRMAEAFYGSNGSAPHDQREGIGVAMEPP